MPRFTPEELNILSRYVTDPTGDVFAVKNLTGIVGAIYARYSRAPSGFKETLLKEFIEGGNIDAAHAQELIDRILVAYGDDSVGELEGAHVSFEKVSAIGEKAICDHRIGGAFIVQSTRYVYYHEKDEQGNYRYYRSPKIMASPLRQQFLTVMDQCFATYAELVPILKKYLAVKKPLTEAAYDINGDGVKEKISQLSSDIDLKAFQRTYNFDLRAKTCDTLRVLLPLCTHHNVGVFGNGRFFQGMISTFYSSELIELQTMGKQCHDGLHHIIPKYVKRASRNDYVVETERAMQRLADRLLNNIAPQPADEVTLLPMATSQEDFDRSTTALMLYGYCRLPLRQLKDIVAKLPPRRVEEIRTAYLGHRSSRRDRPGRALEDGYPYQFDLLVTYQIFKDLQRHRMSSQIWQTFAPHHGFYVPPEIAELGYEGKLRDCATSIQQLYDQLAAAGLRYDAQYAVLHGHKTRWVLQANDRSLMHLLELRSTPQGHPEYRRVAKLMHGKIRKRSPWRAAMMQYVDYGDYYWSRADSEARQRVKEREVEKKYGKKS